MKTNATNKRIRELLSDIEQGKLKLRPPFQRRLVWLNKHKANFIKTIREGYPFPEIFVATGAIDVDTGEGFQVLVDGQQRLNAIRAFFQGSDDIKPARDLVPYNQLSRDDKEEFLEYTVVVRDLGKVSDDEIREAFKRINSTSFPLNAVELDNAQYEGEFKESAQRLADTTFFARNEVFSVSDVRRMRDLRFTLRLIATVISTYFNGYQKVEEFLERFNEHFPLAPTVESGFETVFSFIERVAFPESLRVWRQADVFTLLIELYWALLRERLRLEPRRVAETLSAFYRTVDQEPSASDSAEVLKYRKAATLATNNRNNQIARGEIVAALIRASLSPETVPLFG